MDESSKHHYGFHKSIFSLVLKNQKENNITTSTMHSSTSDFPIAIALLALMAVALLIVSYYIFVIKCCLNWQNLDPLRRFSISRRAPQPDDDPVTIFSLHHRGLDEWLINNIPAFQYRGADSDRSFSFRGCAVCLSEFQEQDMLRVLPRCNHIFHLDCIDVWLLNNASCPLCRSSISGRTKYPIDHIIAPSSSPQDFDFSPFSNSDPDFLVIDLSGEMRERDLSRELSSGLQQLQRKNENCSGNKDCSVQSNKKGRKFQRVSIMGDECIDVRRKDERFDIEQPIRRSFSMDSAADRGLILQVQQIVRQNRYANRNGISGATTPIEEGNSTGRRVRRSSFLSFGHGRGSRSSSILPIENDG